jgi:hypothetical protein
MDESSLPPQAPTPERNLFGQVRTWIDVFPFLRLVRVLRVVGGPIWIIHAFLAILIWWVGFFVVLGDPASPVSDQPPVTLSWWLSAVIGLASPGDLIAPTPMPSNVSSIWHGWFAIAWTSFVWLPTSMLFIRAGALLTAGREMPSYLSTLRLVFNRLWAGVIVFSLPLFCALPFSLMIWAIGFCIDGLGVMFGESASVALDWLSAALVLPIAIVAGLLLIAAKVAAPLGLANLMTIAEADPMDSLSRGYEYTLRRLPQLVGYSSFAILLSVIVFVAWTAVGYTTLEVMAWVGASVSKSTVMIELLLATLPAVLGWSMAGGIFLLLRQSAGGQEVEEIWAEPDGIVAPEMPSVQRKDPV